MAINIDIDGSTAVPVNFTLKKNKKVVDKVETSFDFADNHFEQFTKELNKFQKISDDTSLADLKPKLKKLVDSSLGDGVFDRIYAVRPACNDIAAFLLMAMAMVAEEHNKDLGLDKVRKYMKNNA